MELVDWNKISMYVCMHVCMYVLYIYYEINKLININLYLYF